MPHTSDNVSTKITTRCPDNLPSLHLDEHTSIEAVSQASQASAGDFCLHSPSGFRDCWALKSMHTVEHHGALGILLKLGLGCYIFSLPDETLL